MSDFCWGLQQRGHQVSVLCSDAPYLGTSSNGPNGEPVQRKLQLKGSFHNGLSEMHDPVRRACIDQANQGLVQACRNEGWDAVLVGNLDLLGAELLPALLSFGVPVVHHVGFIAPPYPVQSAPQSPQFRISPASEAVRTSLIQAGFTIPNNRVVYPGARDDLLGPDATGRSLPSPLTGHAKPIGTTSDPLKLCFAGLLMGSKGAHTVIQAMVALQSQGIHAMATFAGAAFQPDYQTALEDLLQRHGMKEQVLFCGNLNRPQLARMYGLHHVGVFASIYPEAFGIVAAEIQASGLALISSGVGGAAEVLEHGQTGLRFQPGNADDLSQLLAWLTQRPEALRRIARAGQDSVRARFSVRASSLRLERLLQDRS